MTTIRRDVKVIPSDVLFDNLDNEKEVNRLLEAGVDPNYRVPAGWWKGWTPLAYAVYKNRPRLVQLLLAHGAYPDQFMPGSWQFLVTDSLKRNNLDIAFFLLKKGARILTHNTNPNCIKAKDLLDSILFITTQRRKINYELLTLLAKQRDAAPELFSVCVKLSFIDLEPIEVLFVCRLIEEIAKFHEINLINYQDLVRILLENRHWEIAHNLIIKDCPIPLLCYERKSQFPYIVGKVQEFKYPPLVWILTHVKNNEFDEFSSYKHENPSRCFEAMLARGANPNETFEHENNTWSLISFSVFHNYKIAVRILLKYGADPHQKISIREGNFNNANLLNIAAQKGHYEIISDLIIASEHKLLEQVDAYRGTALDRAIEYKQLPALSTLLQHGAILRMPKRLYDFLETCDSSDPDVLISLSALCQQQRNFIESKMDYPQQIWFNDQEEFKKIKNREGKLKKLNEIKRKQILNTIDQSTNRQFPTALLNMVADYDAPLQHGSLRFFKLKVPNEASNFSRRSIISRATSPVIEYRERNLPMWHF